MIGVEVLYSSTGIREKTDSARSSPLSFTHTIKSIADSTAVLVRLEPPN